LGVGLGWFGTRPPRMESHAWHNDVEMGANEIDVKWFAIESTQADALEGLEATPSEEDI
jgi:hypothetical protein